MPEDLTSAMLPPDDSVGRPNPYAFWVVMDPDGSVLDVHGTSSRDIRTDAVRIEGPGWTGRLHLLAAAQEGARHDRGAHGERLDVVPDAVTAQAFGFAPPYLRSRSA